MYFERNDMVEKTKKLRHFITNLHEQEILGLYNNVSYKNLKYPFKEDLFNFYITDYYKEPNNKKQRKILEKEKDKIKFMVKNVSLENSKADKIEIKTKEKGSFGFLFPFIISNWTIALDMVNIPTKIFNFVYYNRGLFIYITVFTNSIGRSPEK